MASDVFNIVYTEHLPTFRKMTIFRVCSEKHIRSAQSWTFLKDFIETNILKVESIKLIQHNVCDSPPKF